MLPFFRDYTGRQEFQHAICSLPLEYPPDSQEIYSDLGFMLLGFIVEDAGRQSFQSQASQLLGALTPAPLMFNPPAALRSSIAPTENDPWRGRRLVGEVHDENCWALGGAAGHAGLFGTARAVGDVARVMLGALAGSDSRLASAETVRLFVTRFAGVPDRARSDGTRCCRHLRAVRRCPLPHSAIQVLRGRRYGLIRSAKCTWCF